jgi:adenosine deaminase
MDEYIYDNNLDNTSYANQIRDKAKIDLHVHLNGCFTRSNLWDLAQKYGLPKEKFEQIFSFQNFPEFSEAWKLKNSLVRTYTDFSFLMDGIVDYLQQEHIIYREPAIALFEFPPLDPEKLLDIAATKLNASGIHYSFIMDLIRGDGAKKLKEQYDFYHSFAKYYPIRGVGLAGNEEKHGLSKDLIPIFTKAKADRHGTTIHAGENGSALNIRSALNNFKPDRIGHASNMVNHHWNNNENIFEELGRVIHHEYVPASTLYYGLNPDEWDGLFYSPRTMPKYYLNMMNGYNFSIGSDDPGMFEKSLSDILTAFRFSDNHLYRLMSMANDASFAPPEVKKSIENLLIKNL